MSLEDLPDLAPFKILLRQHTGLDIAATEQEKIKKILLERLQRLKFDSLAGYCLFLNADSVKSRIEWQHLIEKVTIPETFFLRDKGQFNLLRQKLLPDLIARNRHKRCLKIWSAGCSTGEEPYSLALLVQELLPDYQQWQLLILGTDINPQVLEKARQGIYSPWSLRGVEPEVLKYFQAKGNFLHLNGSIKDIVKFQQVNLVKDKIPNDFISGIDLILCRNVFIYFTPDAIRTVVTKFRQCLNDRGYLLTGHGELYQQSLQDLDVLTFPESVVYQKHVHTAIVTLPDMQLPVITPKPVVRLEDFPKPAAVEEKTLFAEQIVTVEHLAALCLQGKYQELITKAKHLIGLQPQTFDAYYWAAKAQASLGDYAAAEHCLQSALAIDTLFCKGYYLLAHIKELQNDFLQAKNFLHKVLYLDESFIPAYLDLVILYQKEGNLPKAQKMYTQALNLLKLLPSEHYIEECEATAMDIISQLETASFA